MGITRPGWARFGLAQLTSYSIFFLEQIIKDQKDNINPTKPFPIGNLKLLT
jgi:hypothetical protein